MINGWNMNREVVLYDARTDIGWTELTAYDDDRLAAGDTFLAEMCEERLVLRQYGEVVKTWSIYDRPADGLRPMLTAHFRANLTTQYDGLVISEDDPSWSDWLDYANALTFATHQHERLEV
jgi:hypothetical protein